MLATLQRSGGSFGVKRVWEADNRRVNLRAMEQFVIIGKNRSSRDLPACRLSALRIRLGECHDFDLRQSPQDVEVDNAAHVSATNQTYS